MRLFAKHPWLVFGLGLAAGYFAHKYRKEIIGTAAQAAGTGKSVAARTARALEDVVAVKHH